MRTLHVNVLCLLHPAPGQMLADLTSRTRREHPQVSSVEWAPACVDDASDVSYATAW